MRTTIEEYALDVSAPERLTPTRREQKKKNCNDTVVRFETMLHVAAGFCDKELVLFLLGRGMPESLLSSPSECSGRLTHSTTHAGADPTALNKDQLTPFHFAILSRNTDIVRFFLSQRTAKNTEGCHPSKAAPDGRTPLQLAVASNLPDMVRLVVRDATVHDVEKCWMQVVQCTGQIQVDIRDILSTKVGPLTFVLWGRSIAHKTHTMTL